MVHPCLHCLESEIEKLDCVVERTRPFPILLLGVLGLDLPSSPLGLAHCRILARVEVACHRPLGSSPNLVIDTLAHRS